jgi:beta-1,4-mannosyl-glycoprotein beta-1,4-N-acetylglucosaminyltransferase
MKIYDCFMFFDEEMLLDLRLNVMDRYVDKFVITESNYMHSGKTKKLIFDINKYSKFKDKIVYIPIYENPKDLIEIKPNDSLHSKQSKMIRNAKTREMYQINKTQDEINKADQEDMIIISDLDEIPNLEEINFNDVNSKLIFFIQKMFYYKFNLFHKSLPWFGSKACKKKYFKSPEWLRSIKNKKYPKWRLDTFFSDMKYSDIYFAHNGGWHFTNIRKPEDLEEKLTNFLHHVDYQESGLDVNDLKRLINEKKIMYNHSTDKKGNKWGDGEKLEIIKLDKLPKHIKDNQNKYIKWLEL